MKTLLLWMAMSLIGVSAFAQLDGKTYAISNVKSGKDLRPYDAGNQNGNKIVLYNHTAWKCMTWKFTDLGDNTYLLQNLFTNKTFQPATSPAIADVGLLQQPLDPKNDQQHWVFESAGKGVYFIKLAGTSLYITQDTDAKTNSPILLKPLSKGDDQKWKLIEQSPTM